MERSKARAGECDPLMQSYAVAPSSSVDKKEDPGLHRKRRWFRAYEDNKRREQDEARDARKYYHDKQWTDEEIQALRKRGQQATIRNRIKRKIDFLVGTEQRLRRDPKAYPRTPQHEKDADVATAGLRYVCDVSHWNKISSDVMHDGLVSGIGVVFIGIENADPVIRHSEVDRFFYDPRSVKPDFSDARYLGLHIWLDIDEAKAKWPDSAERLESMMDAESGSSTAFLEQDRQEQWSDFEGRRVRIVEFWEKRPLPNQAGFGWGYCFFTGEVVLESNWSPYKGEKDEPDCPYEAWSPYVDERGDRYGLIRTLKSIQDEINYSASKYLHRLSTRQFFYKEGAVEDVDDFGRQIARPDGKIKIGAHAEWGKDVGLVDDTTEMRGEAERHSMAIMEMENYGPNPGLTGQGTGVDGASGRALLAQRDSGMTELSPVFERQRDWKLRCYRKMWSRVKQAWQGEKWIRVTDDENAVQFVGLNQFQMDPMTGQISGQNMVAQIDVDIILEEGPDTIVMNEELMQHFSSMGEAAFSPAGKLLIELSNVSNKDRLMKMIDEAMQASQPQGPPPEQIMAEAKMAELQAKGQMDQQKFQADMQLKSADYQLKMLDIQQKQMESETQRELKMIEVDADRQRLEMEREKADREMKSIEHKHRFEVEKMDRQSEAEERKYELETGTRAPKGKPVATADDISALVKALTAKKRVVRDPQTGRALGVETVMDEATNAS